MTTRPQPAAATEAATRVSTLELFFDLVFVFTITQLTTVLVDDATPRGLFQVVLMLCVIWWMYSGYAWLTNAVAADRFGRRLLLIAGMAGFLVMALAIPTAFDGDGLVFGLGYLLITVVHAVTFTRAGKENVFRAILRIAPFNLLSALLILTAGALGGPAAYALWTAAVLVQGVSPYLSRISGFEIAPAHFVERHGLVVIIAFGESIVAIGIGAADLPIDAALIGMALLGLALATCLWWTYFGGDDTRAERALAAAPPERRPMLSIHSFAYAHVPILLGVVAVAAGLKNVIGHAGDHLHLPAALMLSGGVAVYLIGEVAFRRTLGIPGGAYRPLAAVLALAVLPIGIYVNAGAQLGAVVAVFLLGLTLEQVRKPV